MANGPEGPAAIEDGTEEESRMIGQEMVPFRGVEAVEEEQRDAVSPELIRDLGPSTSLGESAQERALVTSSAVEAQEDRASRVRPIGVEKAEEVMSPVQPEELWAGGPTSNTPPVYGPQGGLPAAPLFNFDQLRRMQEMYMAAPHVYGALGTSEVRRPVALEDEEASLRMRLKEIEDKKKEEQASSSVEETRNLKEMMLKMKQENDQLRQMLMMKNGAVEASRGTPAHQRTQEQEFKTPEEISTSNGKGPAATGGRGVKEGEGTSDTVAVMLKLMEGMQVLQEKVLAGPHRGADYMETVKAPMELPKLSLWDPESGPIDFNDWLALIQPYMEDLADTATDWWSEMLKQVQLWYDDHMALTPLARLTHDCQAPTTLSLKKWTRLERRASAMLMASIPDTIKDEILSSRMVTTFGILCKLYVAYQPGGLAEKSLVLAALESPKEETSLGNGVSGLRKWIRWRRRAKDIGVSIPDPTVLVRGLTKLTRKILSAHSDLAFRISLARSTLLLDLVPNHTTVGQFADHLLAELEQLHLQERKKKEPLPTTQDPKIKEMKMDNDKGKSKGKGKEKGSKGERRDGGKGSGGDGEEIPKCRFYLSETGCRKGRACDWSHDQSDGRRRCYACGSPEHMAPECPRGSSNSPTSSRPKIAKAEEEKKPALGDDGSDTSSVKPADETMQQLLQEANRMLKGLQEKDKQPDLSAEDRMKALQQQLDELKFKSLKTLRLTRITKGAVTGLLDSGATHPMRGYLPGEKIEAYPVIMATLASGKTEPMSWSQPRSIKLSLLSQWV